MLALICGLQAATTLPLGRVGLRIVAADLLVIPLLAWILLSGPPPGWRQAVPRWTGRLLLLLGVWLAVAAVLGRSGGQDLAWVLANKVAGFAVLLLYGLLGVIFGRAQVAPRFLGTFAAVCGSIALVSLAVMLAFHALAPDHSRGNAAYLALMQAADAPDASPWLYFSAHQYAQIEGLFANPNAFGLLLAVGIVLAVATTARLRHPVVAGLVLGCLGIALYFTYSRSGWLAVAGGLAVLSVFRQLPPFRTLLVAGLVVLVGAYGISEWFYRLSVNISSSGLPLVLGPDRITLFNRGSSSAEHHGTLAMQALRFWLDAPLTGQGLGSFHVVHGNTIHSTYLWLLSEAGVIGLGLLALAFCTVIGRLLPVARTKLPAAAGLAVLAAAVVAAIGFEVLYQRHLWVLTGFALGALYDNLTPPMQEARS